MAWSFLKAISKTALATAAGTLLLAGAATAQGTFFDPVSGKWIKPKLTYQSLVNRKIPKRYSRQTVRYSTSEKAGTIIIDARKKYLYFVLGDGKAMRYGIGVGKEGFGWKGTVKVARKAKWPSWTPPAEMRIRERKAGRILPVSMKGGPKNPLGARALYLYQNGRDTLYRIHGTNEPWSIGLNVSSGCIRLLNKDVEDLFQRTKVGAKVVVL